MSSLLSTLLASDPLAARHTDIDDEESPQPVASEPAPFRRQAKQIARTEEGKVEYKIIYNDDTEENMLRLLEAKNVFAKQLPKMPKDYIVRLVFDRRHRTFVMLRNEEVIAGCCFRPFMDRKFAEIVFLAVTASEQVRGYGTKLMNELKEYSKTIGINYFLTYADNFATGYFRKQGFTEHLSMTKEQWQGFIKDYDGGTLMGCPVYECVDYHNVSEAVERQKEDLLLGPLLGRNRELWDKVRWEPLKEEIGKVFKPPVNLQDQLHRILDRAIKMGSSWPFREPVKGIPRYSEVITNPIDLKTMMEKNASFMYKTKADFQKDLNLMVQNSISFNGENHEISKLGREVFEFCRPKLLAVVEYNVDYALINSDS